MWDFRIQFLLLALAISADAFHVTFGSVLFTLNLFIVQDEDEFPELTSDNGSSKSSNIQQKISPKVVSNYFILQSILSCSETT